MELVSIIVPVYNVQAYLKRCIDSILDQTFQAFKLILVDDGSPDNCAFICDEYAAQDHRIVVIHKRNEGVSAARNTGIDWSFANCSSTWFTFIDSDDWVHPQYLESLLSAAKTYDALISVGGITRVDEWQPMEHFTISSHCEPSDKLYRYYAEKVVNVSAWGKLYHASCFESMRFPVGKLWEDLATTYKLILAVPTCGVVDQTLYFYFNNPSGTVKKEWTPQRLDEFEAYEEQLEFLSQDPKWKEIHETLQYTYIKAISYSYFMLRESSMPAQEKSRYGKFLSEKMRAGLKRYHLYRKLKLKDNIGIYETAYPKFMHLYWHVVGLLKKLNK